MRRLLLNGSPRGERSNSGVILSWIAEGIAAGGGAVPVQVRLAGKDGLQIALGEFLEADEAILVFPLYTDSMPGLVATFTNELAKLTPAQLRGKRVGYVVHSGFPESAHSEPLAASLSRMSRRLGFEHLGVAIKGGSESFRLNPASGKSKAAKRFRSLGKGLVESGSFDSSVLKALAKPRHYSLGMRLVFRLLAPTGLTNLYWDTLLKRHNAYDRRFDRPYALKRDV